MYLFLRNMKDAAKDTTEQYNLITASGTFDHLHAGHRAFLRKAFDISKKVAIGITSDEFTKLKQYPHLVESFEIRKKHVASFLKKNKLFGRATLFELNDIYGPTVEKDAKIEAILVTEKTQKGARQINMRRIALGLRPLSIVQTEFIKKKGEIVSSSSKRQSQTILNHTLMLPNNLRPELKKPTGMLFKGSEKDLQAAVGRIKQVIQKQKPRCIITVGDVVTKSFNQEEIPIHLAIVDFKIKREETIKNLMELGFTRNVADITIENQSGTISLALSKAIKEAFKKTVHETFIIRVLGEEDLAVLPAIIHASSGTLIFYGQPGEGIVMVDVDNVIKLRTLKLLSQFTTRNP